MSRCKYWDCGWCYAPNGTAMNAVNGACNKPEACLELKAQNDQGRLIATDTQDGRKVA